MHGFNYQNKKTKLGLKVALQNFFKKSNSPKVLEITTSSKLSSEALKNYFKHLSKT
jgi:2-succinyl-5-enolpyruvyl-6-hydroxy-3-cyclohexene-1-carboxylate synthase